MKGSCCVDVSGVDGNFKRKQMMMGSSSNGVDCVNSEFKRLNLGTEPEPEPEPEHDNINHPLLKRVGWYVLILDDPHPNSRFPLFNHLHCLFINFGCQVQACTEPTTALLLLKQSYRRPFDFVLCNIHMKGLDEATLFQLVGLKDVLVIMMSTFMDMSLVTKGMNHGASSFVLRPQTFDDIEHISSFLLKKKKYPSQLPQNLHKKFDQVVHQLGGLDVAEAAPEKILELMNAENIIPLQVIQHRLMICRLMQGHFKPKGTEKVKEAGQCEVPFSGRRFVSA